MKRLLFILLFLPLFSEAQIITTYAGNGTGSFSGDSGPATAAGLDYFCGGTFDKFGNYYFTELGHRVRKISTTGIITTVAGNGTSGFSGDGGIATNAQLHTPLAVAIDTLGNLYVADEENHRIRKVDTNRIITTICGSSINGYSGDGGPASSAILSYPQYICFDKTGNLYISDTYNSRVRKINAAGFISNVAGNGLGIYNGDGGLADTSSINFPIGLCFDGNNNLYIADNTHCRVRKVNTLGIISTVAGNGIEGFSGDGGFASNAKIYPSYLAFDNFGNLYINESYTGSFPIGNRIRILHSSGIISTVVGNGFWGYNGDGGLADTTKLNNPCGITVDSCGNLYVADDYNHRVRKVTFPHCGYESIQNITSSHSAIVIFPNPTHNSLTIASPNKITSLTITSLIGQVVYTHEYSTEKVQVDVSALPPGIYFAKINGTEVRKFVKE